MRRFLRALMVSVAVTAVAAVPAPGRADPGGTADPDGAAAAVAVSYASFRVVRAEPGEPSAPEITLPDGYAFVPGAKYQVASRAEYYAIVQGPATEGVEVSVRWAGVRIAAVVSGKSRLALRPDPADQDRVSFTLRVAAASANATQNTLQVWSWPSPSTASGVQWRIEHNDPDRAAGHWTTVPWPATQAGAVINFMVATEAVLRDSGLIAEAGRRGHFYYLMGFETNNLLHVDNPPHWHIAYYPGLTTGAAKATVPHYWVDAQGRTFYNGQDRQGEGRTRYYAGDPAPILDAEGNLVVTTTIRTDGGLDIDPPAGPRYSITSRTGNYADELTVLRDSVPWLLISSRDDTDSGVLWTKVRDPLPDMPRYKPHPFQLRTRYKYDALTGVVLDVKQLRS
jgi:hypothetical protein